MKKEATILVAEDEDGHFSLIRKNLLRSGLGNNIVRFSDGQQAIDFFRAVPQDSQEQFVLFLDLRMPKASGFDVLMFLKKDPRLKCIPVIVLTTANTSQDIERCHELGCSLYIVKPIEYDHFVEAIQRIGSFLNIIEIPQMV